MVAAQQGVKRVAEPPNLGSVSEYFGVSPVIAQLLQEILNGCPQNSNSECVPGVTALAMLHGIYSLNPLVMRVIPECEPGSLARDSWVSECSHSIANIVMSQSDRRLLPM
jgi:hypothetical protein